MTVDEFREQIKYISKNYKIISTRDIPNQLELEDKCAVLTFDDGLLDHYHVAEILSDMNITGTFLIPTQSVRDRIVIKSHKIQFILASIDEKELVQRILSTTPCYISNTYLWNKYSTSKWKNNWWSPEMVFTTNILRQYDTDNSITNKLFAKIVTEDEEDFCNDLYLNESQIHNIVEAGHDIGSHGYSSEGLTTVGNQEYDISESLKYVRKFCDKDLICSYPNGVYNKDTIELMGKHGCKYAYTTIKNIIDKDTSMLEIPRYDAPQDIKI
jgi:peptidoglycan/xylan/chitin deacetylase (PgdA/CDA1 family)